MQPVVLKETREIGAVSVSVYKGYFESIGSLIPTILVFLLLVIEQIAIASLDFYVSNWLVKYKLIKLITKKNLVC